MVLIADYRLVEQGGVFFRKGKSRKQLPDMCISAFGEGSEIARDDRSCRAQGKTDDTASVLPKL
jgi:hypothetical protein